MPVIELVLSKVHYLKLLCVKNIIKDDSCSETLFPTSWNISKTSNHQYKNKNWYPLMFVYLRTCKTSFVKYIEFAFQYR